MVRNRFLSKASAIPITNRYQWRHQCIWDVQPAIQPSSTIWDLTHWKKWFLSLCIKAQSANMSGVLQKWTRLHSIIRRFVLWLRSCSASGDYSPHFANIKMRLCWSFKNQQHVLCPFNEHCKIVHYTKKQMLPFSYVVNHMPFSGKTPCEQETHSHSHFNLHLPLLHMCRSISRPTTNLCQQCLKKLHCDPLAETIYETFIKSQHIKLLVPQPASSPGSLLLRIMKQIS